VTIRDLCCSSPDPGGNRRTELQHRLAPHYSMASPRVRTRASPQVRPRLRCSLPASPSCNVSPHVGHASSSVSGWGADACTSARVTGTAVWSMTRKMQSSFCSCARASFSKSPPGMLRTNSLKMMTCYYTGHVHPDPPFLPLRTSDLGTGFFHTDMWVLSVHFHDQPTVLYCVPINLDPRSICARPVRRSRWRWS
jgi:hypothetical protein